MSGACGVSWDVKRSFGVESWLSEFPSSRRALCNAIRSSHLVPFQVSLFCLTHTSVVRGRLGV